MDTLVALTNPSIDQVKQALAALRMLFDGLVVGQVVDTVRALVNVALGVTLLPVRLAIVSRYTSSICSATCRS